MLIEDAIMCIEVKNFLTDNDYIEFVLNGTPHLQDYWESYFKDHPEQIVIAEEVKNILLAPVDVDSGISEEESLDLKNRIIDSIKDCLDN